MLEIIFLSICFTFFVSLGMTEGYHWALEPKLVTKNNYHIVRGFTNVAFVLMATFCFHVKFPAALAGILLAWTFYEYALNYVAHGNPFYQKQDFVIGSFVWRHPPVIILQALTLIGLVLFIYFK